MPSSSNQDNELAEFFTDVEQLRATFKNAVAAPTLPKRLLVIHGVGGVGKSSLLKMFRLHCKSVNVPVALASGDDSKSALDVLTHWTEDLKADDIAFPSFSKTFEHYRAIQAKVDEQAKKAQDARGRAADIAGKAASKTAEAAGGALAGAAIGSVIPGIGTAIGGALGGVLGGMGAEALVDWLRGFLTKPDIDLLLDPTEKLTDDFLADVAPAADKRRIVLMLDTFEQMTALDDWARDVAQRVANFQFACIRRCPFRDCGTRLAKLESCVGWLDGNGTSRRIKADDRRRNARIDSALLRNDARRQTEPHASRSDHSLCARFADGRDKRGAVVGQVRRRGF